MGLIERYSPEYHRQVTELSGIIEHEYLWLTHCEGSASAKEYVAVLHELLGNVRFAEEDPICFSAVNRFLASLQKESKAGKYNSTFKSE